MLFSNEIWLTETGYSIKEITNKKGITEVTPGLKLDHGTIKLGSASLDTKFNCSTGKIDIEGSIDSFINDFLAMFSSGSLKTLLNQMKFQTQVELLTSLIARIHYLIVHEGLSANSLKKMYDSTSVLKCVETHLKESFTGNFAIGFGTSKEDMLQADFGIDFMKLVGIQGCISGKDATGLDQEKWKLSYEWATAFIQKIINLSLSIDTNQNSNNMSLECKEYYKKVFSVKNLQRTKSTSFVDSVLEEMTKRMKTQRELIESQSLNTIGLNRKLSKSNEGAKTTLTGGYIKPSVKAEVNYVGKEVLEQTTETLNDTIEKGQEAEKQLENENNNKTEEEEKELKKEKNKLGKIIKDVHFNVTIKYTPNNQTIDILQLNPSENYEVFEYIFPTLLTSGIYKNNRDKEIYEYLIKKIFSLKKVSRIHANQMAEIRKIFEKKKKDENIQNNKNAIYNYCKNFNIDILKKEDRYISVFLRELNIKASKKYIHTNKKITKEEEINIINKNLTSDKYGNPIYDEKEIVKDIIKLQYEKTKELNYKSLFFRDGRPIYVEVKDFLTKRKGLFPISESKEIFLEEVPNNETKNTQEVKILKNTLKLLCIQALDINQEYDFTSNFTNNEIVFDYQSLMLDNMELIDLIRILYELEDPAKLYMFLSKNNLSTNSQLYGLETRLKKPNYEIPEKIFYSQNIPMLEGVSKKDMEFLLKQVKYIKRKIVLTLMRIHGNMYAQLNAIAQQRITEKNSNLMYELEIIKNNMLKRQLMLKLLLDKR